jgi:hypothetical protein
MAIYFLVKYFNYELYALTFNDYAIKDLNVFCVIMAYFVLIKIKLAVVLAKRRNITNIRMLSLMQIRYNKSFKNLDNFGGHYLKFH